MTSIWRHLRRYWRLNLGILLCLTLASVLLVGLSSYAHAVATRALQQTLTNASAVERSLLITGTRFTFSEDLSERLHERLGPVLRERLIIRHALSPYTPQSADQEAGLASGLTVLDVYSYDLLSNYVQVVTGRLPEQVRLNEAKDTWRPPPMEVVIGAEIADVCGCELGQRFTGMDGYHRFDLVGIVEPIDPQDDIWGGDLNAFAMRTIPAESDQEALPLIIAPGSMRSNYPEQPIFLHEVSWRITLDHDLIPVNRVQSLHADLVSFQTQFATLGATTSTGLVDILSAYLVRYSRMRTVLNLLTTQALIFIVYTLVMLSSFLASRANGEIALLSARGASARQITRFFGGQYLVLMLSATLLLGPGLVWLGLQGFYLVTAENRMLSLPSQTWWLSILTVGVGWLTLVLLVYLAARCEDQGRSPNFYRPSVLTTLQGRYIDLYLFFFGGLLFWQLNRSGSLMMRRFRNTEFADPLLLIGPFLLVTAGALVVLRLWPYLLRWFAHLRRHQRSWFLDLSLNQLAREPSQANLVLLQISLTVGFILFSRVLWDVLASDAEPMVAELTSGVFRLNALAMFLLSVAVVYLVHAPTTRQLQLGILHIMGFSIRQIALLLFVGSLFVLLLALTVGVLIGLGLSWMMIPYLTQTLSGVAGQTIPLDWIALVRLCVLLMLGYTAAELFHLRLLTRSGISLATQFGE